MNRIRKLAVILCGITFLPISAVSAVDAAPPGSGGQNLAPVDAAAILQDTPVALLAEFPSGQVLDAREADRRFIPASVTKIMTAYTAFELMDAGKLSPDTRFLVDQETYDEWYGTGSNMFLGNGDVVTLDMLLHGITAISANDACIVLAKGVSGSVGKWTDLMNANARKLGMTNSHFNSPNGWPDNGATYVTAQDLALLSSALIARHPQAYHTYFGNNGYSYAGRTMANHDPITGVVPGADGIKTGFTRQAGYNFVGSAERDGRRLIMVLAGIETPGQREDVARRYIEWGFEQFRNHRIFPQGAKVGLAQVQNGVTDSVELRTLYPVTVSSLPDAPPPELVMVYDGPLRAPFRQGETVARLQVSVPGMAPYSVPLVAGQDVPQASLFGRLKNGIRGIFS
ncbi:MAG: D-alanyl-D-alanine carboxypeptidase family protein [Sphingomonadaceae bacterium]